MKIDVTWEDINNGHRADHCNCPIALAASRAFGFPITATYGGLWKDVITPLGTFHQEIQDWMYNFDLGKPVDPISFEISSG